MVLCSHCHRTGPRAGSTVLHISCLLSCLSGIARYEGGFAHVGVAAAVVTSVVATITTAVVASVAATVVAAGVAASVASRGVELALDERQSLRAVDADVLLVVVGVVAVTAVRILRVAVRLDLARVGADETGWARSELHSFPSQ